MVAVEERALPVVKETATYDAAETNFSRAPRAARRAAPRARRARFSRFLLSRRVTQHNQRSFQFPFVSKSPRYSQLAPSDPTRPDPTVELRRVGRCELAITVVTRR